VINVDAGCVCWPGRLCHGQGHYEEAVRVLKEGLAVAGRQGQAEHEAKMRQQLGLALCACGQPQAACEELRQSVDLLDDLRREPHCGTDAQLSLYDLQTTSLHALQVCVTLFYRQLYKINRYRVKTVAI
jgi:tetratricopeptide (TPR) repeat protein